MWNVSSDKSWIFSDFWLIRLMSHWYTCLWFAEQWSELAASKLSSYASSSHPGCRLISHATSVYVPKMSRVCGAEYLLYAHQSHLNIRSGNAVFLPRGKKPEFCLPGRCPPQRFPITMNNSNRSKQNIYNSGKLFALDICFGSIGMKNGNMRM